MQSLVSFDDWRNEAKRRLPRLLFDYVDGGSYSEKTMARNVLDLGNIALRQRVMVDVSQISLATEVLGQTLSMPVLLGPVGLAGMFSRRGEVAASRAAEQAGITFCLSTSSVCSLEEVHSAGGAPFWFQLYMIKDRDFMVRLLDRALAAECPALIFTVDLALPGARYRDVRSGFNSPPSAWGHVKRAISGISRPRWTSEVYLRGRPHILGNLAEAMTGSNVKTDFWGWVARNWDSSVDWNDIAWLRQKWPRPIILKGILDPDDARRAVELGVDGIIVSNHGGRQLDGAVSSVRALPSIVRAAEGRVPVLVDGGIRSGLDVLKMLSLGASACLLGRAWAFPLAARGQQGVSAMLRLMRQELEVAMALTGCTDVRQVSRLLIDDRE